MNFNSKFSRLHLDLSESIQENVADTILKVFFYFYSRHNGVEIMFTGIGKNTLNTLGG